jgi:hypothetical protein
MFEHCGLFFTKQHIDTARKNAKREPFKSAWAFLDAQPDMGLLETAHLDALRYRSGKGKGQQAIKILQRLTPPENISYLDILRFYVAAAQVFEMVSDIMPEKQSWLEWFFGQVPQPNDNLPFHEGVWLVLLNTSASVLWERDDLFQDGVNFYKHVIDHEVHPQGYIQSVIEVTDGYMLHRFLIALQGLSLLADAATNAGTNLWAYNNRGVSLITAGLYPLYYYFYPEQWKWGTLPPEAETQALFKHYGSFLEIMNFRINRTTKAIDLILADLRPVFDVYGGGLTTLTHGVRRGLFG